jgi:hypothetical protein
MELAKVDLVIVLSGMYVLKLLLLGGSCFLEWNGNIMTLLIGITK